VNPSNDSTHVLVRVIAEPVGNEDDARQLLF
jgi:hypothetical protein